MPVPYKIDMVRSFINLPLAFDDALAMKSLISRHGHHQKPKANQQAHGIHTEGYKSTSAWNLYPRQGRYDRYATINLLLANSSCLCIAESKFTLRYYEIEDFIIA